MKCQQHETDNATSTIRPLPHATTYVDDASESARLTPVPRPTTAGRSGGRRHSFGGLVLFVYAFFGVDARAAEPTQGQFRTAAACAGCTVRAVTRLSLHQSNVEAYSAKLADGTGGTRKVVTLLGDGVTIADAVALHRAERDAHRAKFGRMTRRLHERVQTSSSDESLAIAIWTTARVPYPPREELLADSAKLAAHKTRVSDALNEKAAPILSAIRAAGGQVAEDGAGTPLIRAVVRASRVGDLSADANVDVVDVDEAPRPALGDGSNAWHYTDRFHVARQTTTASGVPVCVYDAGPPLSIHLPYLRVAEVAPSTAPPTDHPGYVASFISNQNPAATSPTDSALVYITSTSGAYIPSPGAPNVWSWCFAPSRDVRIINASLGSEGAADGVTVTGLPSRQYDFVAKNSPWPLIVLIAGNGNGYVENRSYNTIIVGGSNFHGDDNIANDTLYGTPTSWLGSGWRNPPSPQGDRELPHMVAPACSSGGTGDIGLKAHVYIPPGSSGQCGTSYAAPQVTSAAMMMHARDPGFKSWPEMSRAVLLATSVHNVDGGAFGALGSLGAGDLKDGVGALQAAWAVDLANPSNWRYPSTPGASKGRYKSSLTFATDFPSGYGPSFNVSIAVTGRLRAALAWDSTASGCPPDGYGCTSDILDGDLDLELYDGSNNLIYFSNSWDNSWEAIDLPVTAGETYRLQIRLVSQATTHTYAGIAWYNYVPGTE